MLTKVSYFNPATNKAMTKLKSVFVFSLAVFLSQPNISYADSAEVFNKCQASLGPDELNAINEVGLQQGLLTSEIQSLSTSCAAALVSKVDRRTKKLSNLVAEIKTLKSRLRKSSGCESALSVWWASANANNERQIPMASYNLRLCRSKLEAQSRASSDLAPQGSQ